MLTISEIPGTGLRFVQRIIKTWKESTLQNKCSQKKLSSNYDQRSLKRVLACPWIRCQLDRLSQQHWMVALDLVRHPLR